MNGLSGLSNRYKLLTTGFPKTAWTIICHFLYDFLDPTISIDRVYRAWTATCSMRMETSDWYAAPIQADISLQPSSDEFASLVLLRTSAFSLLDLLLFMWKTAAVYVSTDDFQEAILTINDTIRAILSTSFDTTRFAVSPIYNDLSGSTPDAAIYRTAAFYDEYKNIANWRAALNRIIFPGTSRRPSLTSDQHALVSASQCIAATPAACDLQVVALRALETSVTTSQFSLGRQDLLRAALVGESLQYVNLDNEPALSPLINLLSTTENVHHFIPQNIAATMIVQCRARRLHLLIFILCELAYRRSRTEDNELERRLSFMEAYRSSEANTLPAFFDRIAVDSPAAAILLAQTCTRSFLERLYLVMTSIKDVLQARS